MDPMGEGTTYFQSRKNPYFLMFPLFSVAGVVVAEVEEVARKTHGNSKPAINLMALNRKDHY